jgi:hypothetical protein
VGESRNCAISQRPARFCITTVFRAGPFVTFFPSTVLSRGTGLAQLSRVLRKDKRNDWRFEPGPAGWVWYVRRVDGTSQLSSQSFPTLNTCIGDAITQGYVAWMPEGERRNGDTMREG